MSSSREFTATGNCNASVVLLLLLPEDGTVPIQKIAARLAHVWGISLRETEITNLTVRIQFAIEEHLMSLQHFRTTARLPSTLLALSAVLSCSAGCWTTTPSERFIDQPMNQSKPELSGLSARITIAPDSTSQQGLIGFVGLILQVDAQPSNGKPPVLHSEESFGKYRPNADQVQVDAQTGKVLYQGKVTKGFNVGGDYMVFAANFSEDQAAEVTIKDEVTVGFKDPGKIPYDKLAEEAKRVPEGKRWYFVTSATLTSVVHKNYNAIKADAKIAGTAFGANGKVYSSNEDFTFDPVVSLKVEDIGLLNTASRPRAAQGAPAIAPHEAALLARKTWTPTDAAKVSEILSRHSAPAAHQLLRGAVLRPDEPKK
jgi:hypothetical protein